MFKELHTFLDVWTTPSITRGCNLLLMSPQRRGFCSGSHVTSADGFPQQYVEVKCEIYEPQVSASATVEKHHKYTFSLLLSAALCLSQTKKRQCLHLYFTFTCRVTLFFSFSSGCCTRGSRPCKSRRQGRRASPAFGSAQRRRRGLMCSQRPWNCLEPASSCQILPSSQLLSQPSQTQHTTS